MMKEIVQMLMKDDKKLDLFKSGRLQFAGISTMEQRALIDVLKNKPDIREELVWC